MGLKHSYIKGQTPLDEEEMQGLLIPGITTRGELDEFEQNNIEQAMLWSMSRKFSKEKILTEVFVKNLHKRMYGQVWKWAGTFRKSEKNIGINYWQIETALRQLLDDTAYQIANNSYSPDEICIRFKHRLVSIHCFPNGNGRHSRLLADILIKHIFNKPVFSWGAANLTVGDKIRDIYLKSLKAADSGDITKLMLFARS